MRNQYVFLDNSGNVKSTLITPGNFKETDRVLKVDDCSLYIGKKVIDGKVEDIAVPSKPTAVDTKNITEAEFKRLVLKALGVDVI